MAAQFHPAHHGEMTMQTPRRVAERSLAVAAIFVTLAAAGTRFARVFAASDAGKSGYHLVKTIKVGGDGFWDCLAFDSATRRLFISRGTKVMVVDVDAGKVVGEIPDTPGVHGIALPAGSGNGFTTNGQAGNVSIFDSKTLQVVGHADAGKNPDAIVYDPATKRIFAMNGRGNDATAIDVATGKAAGTVALGGAPEFAVSDGAGHVYVNLEDKSQVQQIDSRNLVVTATWPLAPCEGPSGLAIDEAHHRLFSACHNKLMAILDADSGKVIATVPIGAGVDGAEFDPGTGFAFASNGQSATLSVVHEDAPDKFTAIDDVPTQMGARTMTIDPKTHQVFLVTAQFTPPPAPTAENPRPRPGIVPDSFVVLVYGR